MYWSVIGRALLAVAALLTMIPGTITDVIGIALLAVAFVLDKFVFKPGPKEARTPSAK